MHPHMVIPDLESSVCHLQMKHKGSISCKYLYFATLILFSYYFPFPLSVLTSAKKARLQELIGEVEEDELEGWAVVGLVGRPQHTIQVVHCLFVSFSIFAQKYLFKTCSSSTHPHPYSSPSQQMILLRRRLPNCQQRKRGILILYRVGFRWGGFPSQPEKEAWGLLIEVSLSYLLFL